MFMFPIADRKEVERENLVSRGFVRTSAIRHEDGKASERRFPGFPATGLKTEKTATRKRDKKNTISRFEKGECKRHE